MATSRRNAPDMQGQMGMALAQPPCGSVRECPPYRGELGRTRVITADGFDYVVATAPNMRTSQGYLTSAYPVSRGYLVMMRQALCDLPSANAEQARERHIQLTQALAEAGVRLVRARHTLAARRRAERAEALSEAASGSDADWLADALRVHAPVGSTVSGAEFPFSASVR